jgi:hypothetical protein
MATKHQYRFSINVLVGIINHKFLGPIVLLNRLTGAICHRFLVKDLSVLLAHVPLHQRQPMWFMHDGAPSHFLRIIRPLEPDFL